MSIQPSISRRTVLRAAALGGTGLAAAPLLTACNKLSGDSSTKSSTLKIGFVSPRTGPAAGFGEPDGYVLSLARKALQGGLTIGGTK
jgi:branched-chain amino acid transport system substrate-binding protein